MQPSQPSQPLQPAPPAARMRLGLAGNATATSAAGTVRPLAAFDALLLAWLALEGPTPRERLAAMLWPDKSAEAARNSLRQRLFQLRKSLGDSPVAGLGSMLALAPGVEHDLHGADTVLAELDATTTGEFRAWLLQQRQQRSERVRRSLTERADSAEQAHQWADALSHARALLRLDALSEAAHRRLMRLHYLAGDRAAALLAFDALERMLKDEVGARPSGETLALLDTIEGTAAPRQRLPAPQRTAHAAARAAAAGDAQQQPEPAAGARKAGRAQPTAGDAALRPAHPGALHTALLRPPVFVGRGATMQALVRARPARQHIVVLGEAGMGKSRLLEAYLQQHGPALSVCARPGDAGQAHALLARIVRALVAFGCVLPEALRAQFARFVPELGDADPNRIETAALERTLEALLALLPAGSALIVDDLHFADRASVELLARAAQPEGSPPLVMGARADDGAEALAVLRSLLVEAGRLDELALPPLAPDEVVDLVQSLGLAGADAQALAAPLLRHTGGNPQFVLETLRAMWFDAPPGPAAGAESPAAVGRVLAPAGHGLPVPTRVGTLIERRLKRLSAPALKLARVGAIAGRDFSAPLAAEVLGCDPLDLADAWGELESTQVLADHGFAHDLVYEAVKRGIPAAIARPLHAGVAAVLARRDAHPASVAAHWLAAGEYAPAIEPLQRAIEIATRASGLREVAELNAALAEALARCDRHAERMRALSERLVALTEVTAGEEVDRAVDEFEALAASDAEHALAHEHRARIALGRFDQAGALGHARQSVELAQRSGDRAIECDARVVQAQALLRMRRADEAAGVLATVQDWAQREAPLAQRHLFEQCRAWLAVETERYGEAIELWTQCAELARREGSMSNVALALSYQGLAYGGQGRWAKSVQSLERELALMNEYRMHGGTSALVHNNLAHAYLHAGRYADALAAIERAEADSQTEPSSIALRRAHLYLVLGQPARARTAAERALERARTAAMRHAPLLALARVRHALGAPAAGAQPVQDFIGEAQRLSAELQRPSAGIRVTLVRAECARGAARVAVARQALSELAGREAQGLRLAAQVRLAQGLMETGDPEAARGAAEAALVLAESYEPEFLHRAEVRLVAIRAFDACGDARARTLLSQAVDELHRTAATQVPAEFRASFLERVGPHRELVTLGSRLALAP